jgi:hypothetical protein
MHNNGTFSPANTDLSVSLTAPGDCAKTPNTPQDQQDTALVASTAVPVSFTWSMTCTSGGSHTFTASSTVTLDEVLHVVDPNTANNTAGNSGTTIVGTPTPTPTPSPTPTPPPPDPPTPSPTVAGVTATPSPVGGTPVAVGGVVGLIDEDGTRAPSETSAKGGESDLTLGALSAGMALVLAGAWVTRRRLFG